MKLRAHWDHRDHASDRATLNVDVLLPKFYGTCTCPSCIGRRMLGGLLFIGGIPESQEEEEHSVFPNDMPEDDRAFIEALLGVHGVTSVYTDKYTVGVVRGVAFPWSEIKPRITSIIAEWSGMEIPEPEQLTLWQQFRNLFSRVDR